MVEKDEKPGENEDSEIEEGNDEEQSPKKPRKFSAKEFRQELKTGKAFEALKGFVKMCLRSRGQKIRHDYVYEYIESGGSCKEILEVLTSNDTVKLLHSSVLSAFNIILLKTLSEFPDKQPDAEKACLELIDKQLVKFKYIFKSKIHYEKKRVVLKLLSTLVTISPEIAKEVLSYVNFTNEELEFLTRHSVAKTGSLVRIAFINFLVSFLIEGSDVTVKSLLDKSQLFTCVFGGMKYDHANTVILFLTAIKNNILENSHITKTLKMSTFNTFIIKHIMNLYDWKGPENFGKKKNKVITLNRQDKKKVSLAVHEFLLVLCTSHKHGIIFRDSQVGLGVKKLNPLMFTVLRGIDKPWDHALSSELIIKICFACPDLVQYILKCVEPYLDPRPSQKWLNAINFVRKLLEFLKPQCIEQYLEKMSIANAATIITTFTLPKNLFSCLKDKVFKHEDSIVRHECILLLEMVLNNVQLYLDKVDNIESFSQDFKFGIKKIVYEHFNKHLPSSANMMKAFFIKDFKLETKTPLKSPDLNIFIHKLLLILHNYQLINPHLVEDICKDIDPLVFLQYLQTNFDDDQYLSIHVKGIQLLMNCNSSLFLPNTEIFSFIVPILICKFQTCTEMKMTIESILFKILSLTNIFQGSEREIFVWLYSLLELKWNDKISNFLVESLNLTSKNLLKYIDEISSLRDVSEDMSKFNLANIIESLEVKMDQDQNINELKFHIILSPFVFGLLECLQNSNSKKISQYINIALVNLLHSQTSPKTLMSFILKKDNKLVLSSDLRIYFKSWNNYTSMQSLENIYKSETVLMKFNKFLLEDSNLDDFLKEINDIEWKPHYNTVIVNMIIFYFAELSAVQMLTSDFQQKCLNTIVHLLENTNEGNKKDILNSVLNHPTLIRLFMPLYTNKNETEGFCTEFITCIIQFLINKHSKNEINEYLKPYQLQIVKRLHVMLNKCKKKSKPAKSARVMEIIKLFEISYKNCVELIEKILNLPQVCFVIDENSTSVLVNLLSYILCRIPQLYVEDRSVTPVHIGAFQNINGILLHLYGIEEINLEVLENSLHGYINQFPHTIACLTDDVFKSILSKSVLNRSTIKIAALLLQCNSSYLSIVSENLENIVSKRELVFALLNVIDIKDTSAKNIFETVFKEHENMILKFLNKPQKVPGYIIEYYKTLKNLVITVMGVDKCKEFASKHYKFDSTQIYHVEILTAVYDKCIQCELTGNEKYISNYIITIINLLINILKRGEKTDDDWHKVQEISKLFIEYCDFNISKTAYVDDNLCKTGSFQILSKLCLKYGIENRVIFLELLRKLCGFTNGEQELGVIFEMATSHSECLNVLLSNTAVKPSLIELLLVLCKKSPSVKIKAHIPVWLGAYNATLSQSDQHLLELLMLYENADLGFYEYRPYLWGNTAVVQYSVRVGIGSALHRYPKSRDVFDLFDENKITNTVTHFPYERSFELEQKLNSFNNEVYDPAFYLPLFSFLMAPESAIKWFICKRRGAIAIVIVALASEVKEVRTAAFHCLARFHSLLESSSMGKDRLLWLHLVEATCQGISSLDDLHISNIVAVFLARCAMIFSQPSHPMYSALGQYIMAKECPNFTKIPEFLTLLHSSDINFKVHRLFILEVIQDGLKTEHDFKIMTRNVAFKYLMDLFNCVLINIEGKKLILNILTRAIKIPLAARVLLTGQALLPWIQFSCDKETLNDTDLVKLLINLICVLVDTMNPSHLRSNQFTILLILSLMIGKLRKFRMHKLMCLKFIRTLYKCYKLNCRVITRQHLDGLYNLSNRIDSEDCKYYLLYGVKYVPKPILLSQEPEAEASYYLKLLTLKWIRANDASSAC